MTAPPEHGLAYPHVTDGATFARPATFAADAVVVGSGAGGATAAARLRAAGLDVLVVEEGALERTETFTTDPATMLRRLYRDAGTSMILGRPGIVFAEGRCVGGSTVINGGMSWRAPERVLAAWERDLGLAGTGPRAMEPYFAEAERILHVEPNHEDTFGRNTLKFVEGARRLGWPVARAPRNMRRCVGLNNCALGCPTGAKQSMLVTEIPRLLAAGGQLLTRARVDRVLFRGGRAAGVRGRLVGPGGRARVRFTVHAPLVVLAAGARHTPAILKRSWLRARPIGRGLHTHPNAKVVGIFEERLDPWIGTHQAFHVHHFLDEGILIGYAAVPPGLLAAALPGFGAEHAARMRLYNHMLTAAALIEDEGEGRVVLGPDRQPYMFFDLTGRDLERVHRGVALAAELLFAAGARRVLLPFADLPELTGPEELRRIAARPRVARGIELMTVHIMGTARMAPDPARGATDASGAVHGVPGLVVADASVIPSSIGVNPQETIVALALRNAERWLDTRRG
ncbi:MAG TPA: GMC family oxidoreductase [Candidatus Binatia bacterium]|nr:GMC family oxidoreductase [Candidatus Binatia bacterium]